MNSKKFKFLITIIFFLVSIQLTFSKELLVPPKKPVLSRELIKKKVSSNYIIPKKKYNTQNTCNGNPFYIPQIFYTCNY